MIHGGAFYAMRKRTTSAWMVVVSAPGTPTAYCIVEEPMCSAAK
jgi:hypothetical protein